MVDPKKPIRRAQGNRMLGGVLAGLADWCGCDASVARVAYIILTVFTGFALGIVAYALLWVFLPVEGAAAVSETRSHEGAAAR
jgi:phage shock protein C